MSATAGIFCRDGSPLERAKLERMASRLAHRGPDGCFLWSEGPVGLAYLHLETSASPPSPVSLLSLNGQTIAGDLRLDNSAHLKNTHELEHTAGDAGIALRMFQDASSDAFARLRGDFALAIWNSSNQSLICARDHMGIKPLYYFITPRVFAFATEIKALLALEDCPKEANESRIAEYLALNFEDLETTFYKGIFRLRPAHQLAVTRDSLRISRFWSFDPTKALKLKTDDDYAEALRQELIRSVRERLLPNRTGSFLSGGLDSSSISAIAARTLHEQGAPPLHSFTFAFPGLTGSDLRRIDERHFAEAVARSAPIQHHLVECDRLDPLQDFHSLCELMDEPFIAPNLYLHRAVYKAARELGLPVILDGIDGDTTISHGTELLPHLLKRLRWIKLFHECRSLSRVSFSYLTGRQVLWTKAVLPALPALMTNLFSPSSWEKTEDQGPLQLLNPDFIARTGLKERLDERSAASDRLHRSSPRFAHFASLTSPLYPTAFEMMDKVAAESRIDARYPFFDRELMELCLSFPAEVKLRDGWTRWILRKAMDGVLPPEVQWRKRKADLSPNFLLRFAACGRELYYDAIQNNSALDEYFKPGVLKRTADIFFADPLRHPREPLMFLSVLSLSRWLQRSRNTSAPRIAK